MRKLTSHPVKGFHQNGRIWTLPRLGGEPEFVPVGIVAGFGQCAEVAHAGRRPKLAGPFEPALLLPARRLHRPAPNRPAALRPTPPAGRSTVAQACANTGKLASSRARPRARTGW